MRWGRCIGFAWLCLHAAVTQAQETMPAASAHQTALSQQRAQARQQQARLRERLAALQQAIAAHDLQRRDVSQALRTSEQAISTLTRELHQLHAQSEALQADMVRLSDAITQQTAVLDQHRQTLAVQLRSQYMHPLSPWTAWLMGEDPQTMRRALGYFSYVSTAQTQTLQAIQQAVLHLENLQTQAHAQQQALADVRAASQTRMLALKAQQQAQQQQLRTIEHALRTQQAQADHLLEDVRGLDRLMQTLETQLAQQAQVTQAGLQPSDALKGLEDSQEKLPYPVAGELHGRFGRPRPEGGLWRGLVIRAAQGEPVHAVAPGQVVYASWLTGFGNLMIIDHGAQYLTIYAYNHSLLLAVGDRVSKGQVIAHVGATGGQVEPGLYFEIRHKGTPVNPRLWLQP